MRKRLLNVYLLLLIPEAVAGIAGYLLIQYGQFTPLIFRAGLPYRETAAGIIIAAAATGVAAPVLVRSLFAYRLRGREKTTGEELFRFEMTTLAIAMATPGLGALAIWSGLIAFHLYAVIFISLYAAYFFFPTEKKLTMDRAVFRVEGHEGD